VQSGAFHQPSFTPISSSPDSRRCDYLPATFQPVSSAASGTSSICPFTTSGTTVETACNQNSICLSLPKGLLLQIGSIRRIRSLAAPALAAAQRRGASILPSSEIERDGHAGITQIIRGITIRHGPGHNHSSDAQGGNCLCLRTPSPFIFRHAACQDTNHRLEHIFESALRFFTATGHIRRQRNHRA
jgi:hypothetical protein